MTRSHTQDFNHASGGRVRSASVQDKLYPISFRVNAKQKAMIRCFADRRDQSVSQYVRSVVLCGEVDGSGSQRGQPDPTFRIETAAKILGALGESGVLANLSALAEAAEAGALPLSAELEAELHNACALVLAIRNDLIGALGIKPKD